MKINFSANRVGKTECLRSIIASQEKRIADLKAALDLVIGFCGYGCEQCKDGASVCDTALAADSKAEADLIAGLE